MFLTCAELRERKEVLRSRSAVLFLKNVERTCYEQSFELGGRPTKYYVRTRGASFKVDGKVRAEFDERALTNILCCCGQGLLS